MRRVFLLISVGVLLVVAGLAWMAEGQLDGRKTGSPLKQPADASVQPTPRTKVDINHASVEELSKLPGITLVLADRIVQHRPYRKLDDLVTRKVLGKKQFAKIRELVVINSRDP
jgi:DNA uptake protein ComE-like DNA-binding protein